MRAMTASYYIHDTDKPRAIDLSTSRNNTGVALVIEQLAIHGNLPEIRQLLLTSIDVLNQLEIQMSQSEQAS